jgi:hypothetical protein
MKASLIKTPSHLRDGALAAGRHAGTLVKSGVVILALLIGGPARNAAAQSQGTSKSEAAQPAVAAADSTKQQYLGPAADTIKPYRPAGRDPFRRDVKPKFKDKARAGRTFGFPPLDSRRMEFRQKVEQARARDAAEPDPVSQYLVSELDVTGVFRDDRGFGAFVKALPSGTVFFVRGGTPCYNGQVVRVEGDSDSGGARVLFREAFLTEVKGKETRQERVVAKAPTISAKK